MNETIQKAILNQVIDATKKELSREEIIQLVKELQKTMSIRQLAIELNIPRTTLQHMILPNKKNTYIQLSDREVEKFTKNHLPKMSDTNTLLFRMHKLLSKMKKVTQSDELILGEMQIEISRLLNVNKQ